MNKLNFQAKKTGDTLEASEWNSVVSKVDELVEASNTSGSGGSGEVIDSSGTLSVSAKGNVTVNSNKNINLEPAWDNNTENYSGNYGDVAVKPGDDIQLCSHHREPKKRDKVVVKALDGNDNPVKLELGCGEIAITTKGKAATLKKNKTTGADVPNDYMFKTSEANVMDVKILTGNTLDEGTADEREERGYLKVRAQAIDLRCEKHGGVSLQPKGYDSDGNMNKIKFEHGGGDGLEFGTFNTEKSSLFTDEYRFKKDGVWKMATRQTTANSKAIYDDNTPVGKTSTAALKYVKQEDDFYDIISEEDAQTTTEDIIKTAAALNNDFIETSLSTKKNLKISASSTYKIVSYEGTAAGNEKVFTVDKTQSYSKDQLKLILAGETKLSDYIDTKLPFLIDGDEGVYRLSGDITPKISLEAEEEIDLEAKYGDVCINSGDTIKMEAPEIRLNGMNADKTGGIVNFGATQDVLFINSKLTKGLKVEASANPTKIKQVLQNNTLDTVYWDETNSIFRVPMKKIYADAEHTTEVTPSNWNDCKEKAAYFADGTILPEDYTCFGFVTTEESGVYTTNIYKYGTKGSAKLLSKNYKHVAQYTSSTEGVLGNRVSLGTSDEITTLEFEFPGYTGGSGINAVAPEAFVTVSEIQLSDVIDIISELKTMKANHQGPWAV